MESYEKIREVGKGSYGVVWLVKNKKDRKNVYENSKVGTIIE
jgi:serine/threonine protein kinase